jgi:hypothetical protein
MALALILILETCQIRSCPFRKINAFTLLIVKIQQFNELTLFAFKFNVPVRYRFKIFLKRWFFLKITFLAFW